LDAVLLAFKFRRLRYLGPPLARLAALRLREQLADIDVVVPVPLHWRRRLQRGFDQAELLARTMAQALDRPCRRALKRRRSTPAQSLLTKTDRRRNLTGAFALGAAAACHGRHVLLVDDVLTTGATVETAARVLMAAQPKALTVLTMARTPANGKLLKHP
jgi:ComF family protein